MNIITKAILILGVILFIGNSQLMAQGVAINTDGSDPDASALLDLKSTSLGLLVPRMTEVQRDAIVSPATGLIVFQSDGNVGFYFYDGSAWSSIGAGVIAINDLDDGKTGGNSIFLGEMAGFGDDATDNFNVGIGNFAMQTNIGGFNNTAIGHSAMMNNDDGKNNVSVGFNSMLNNVSGLSNSALGSSSLKDNIDGDYNAALGNISLNKNTSGANNVALGYAAGNRNTSGNNNVLIGSGANRYNETGSRNVIIGHLAGRGTSTHNKSGNIFIGYQAGFYETGSNKLYIENSNSSTPLIYGNFQHDILAFNADSLHVNTNNVNYASDNVIINADSVALNANTVNINDVLHITPRATPPANPQEGDIYVDVNTHDIFCYLDGIWEKLNP